VHQDGVAGLSLRDPCAETGCLGIADVDQVNERSSAGHGSSSDER
jgi:hypothetical protein